MKKSTELSHQLWYKLETYLAFLIKAATNPNTYYVLGVKTNELNNIERVVLLPEELLTELFFINYPIMNIMKPKSLQSRI